MNGINLSLIHIRNYKSIKELFWEPRNVNILIGENNAGKSSLLEAIKLGLTFDEISDEDIFQPNGSSSEDHKVIIDLVFYPTDDGGGRTSIFSDAWEMLGSDIQIAPDASGQQWLGIRTIISYNESKNRYENVKRLLKQIPNLSVPSPATAQISRETLSYFAPYYLPANRDITSEVNAKRSVWSMVTSRVKFSGDCKSRIEDAVISANKAIVGNNPFLLELADEMKDSIKDPSVTINIVPINQDVEKLYKGMNIYVSSNSIEQIPPENLGQGSRSWSVFSVYKYAVKSEMEARKSARLPFCPLFLIEEPEAHIHPQAQTELASQIFKLPGQVFMTTHSPFSLDKKHLFDVFRTYQENGQTRLAALSHVESNADYYAKFVRSGGDFLFSRALVLTEGETEWRAFPIYYEGFFHRAPYSDGVHFLQVRGHNYEPLMLLAKTLHIPYFIFADGEAEPHAKLLKSLKNVYQLAQEPADFSNYKMIKEIPNGDCYEKYVIAQGLLPEVEAVLNSENKSDNFLDEFILIHNGHVKNKSGDKYNFSGPNGRCEAAFEALKKNKTGYAEPLADKLVAAGKIPSLIQDLFNQIRTDLKLPC